MKFKAKLLKLTEKSDNMQGHKTGNQMINLFQFKWK